MIIKLLSWDIFD